MLKRHGYENVEKSGPGTTPTSGYKKNPLAFLAASTARAAGMAPGGRATPTSNRATPTSNRATPTSNWAMPASNKAEPAGVSPSKGHGYENVVPVESTNHDNSTRAAIPRAYTVSGLTSQTPPPPYEELEDLRPRPPVRTSSCSMVTSSGQPLSFTSTSNSRLPSLGSPPSNPANHNVKQSEEEGVDPIQHHVTVAGAEYAIVNRRPNKLESQRETQPRKVQQLADPSPDLQSHNSSGEGHSQAPPIPLRAFQRMSSRENLADFREEVISVGPEVRGVVSPLVTSSTSSTGGRDNVEDHASHLGGANCMLNENALALAEEQFPDPHAPHPYEVASTPSNKIESLDEDQLKSLKLDPIEVDPHGVVPLGLDPPEVDPPYEEIEKDEELQLSEGSPVRTQPLVSTYYRNLICVQQRLRTDIPE